ANGPPHRKRRRSRGARPGSPPLAERPPLLGGLHRAPARLAEGEGPPLPRHRRPLRGPAPPRRAAARLSRTAGLRALPAHRGPAGPRGRRRAHGRDRSAGRGVRGMSRALAALTTASSRQGPARGPLPLLLAHGLASGLAEDRRAGAPAWLRPDGKTQVSVAYEEGVPARVCDVLVSTQHAPGVEPETVRRYVETVLAPRVLGR